MPPESACRSSRGWRPPARGRLAPLDRGRRWTRAPRVRSGL